MHDLGLIHPLSCKMNRMCLSEAGGQVEMQQHMNIAKYTSNRSVHNFGKLFFFKKWSKLTPKYTKCLCDITADQC